MLEPIIKFLEMIFNSLHQFVLNIGVKDTGISYVLAVLLITILVRVILLPLNIKQLKSQAKMQEVQPLLQKIQAKYKNDPQKSQMEMMKLYKENNISPLSGCLPLIIQMPILFALYYVFMRIDIGGSSFLWLKDLQKPDPYYILPIVSAATTYISSYIMTKTTASTQQTGGMNMNSMNIVMSLMSGFIALRIGSLLVLYWIMGNIIQLIQTYFLVVRPAKAKTLANSATQDNKKSF